MSDSSSEKLTYGYIALRRAVGLIGFLLPFVLVIGLIIVSSDEDIQPSISHYYHTAMGDVFVGCLCAVALFMFFYIGYDSTDNCGGTFAGFCALGVAWFPTSNGSGPAWIGTIHFIAAGLLFLTLAWFSYFRFTKSKGEMTERKKARNNLYRIAGIVIIACILTIATYKISQGKSDPYPLIVLIGETIALIAFGTSWIIKGEMILKDT